MDNVLKDHRHPPSFRHYATGREGRVEIESEWTARKRNAQRENSAQSFHCPTQANIWLEWATRPRHIWQRRFYDFVVWTEKKRVEKLRYMHRNPVRRGLVL